MSMGKPASERALASRPDPAVFQIARLRLELFASHSGLLDIASRLWCRAPHSRQEPSPIRFELEVVEGLEPEPIPERTLVWRLASDEYQAEIPGQLSIRIQLPPARVSGSVNRGLLERFPSTVARTLFEAPLAALLGYRLFQPLHAGAVVGPRGAVVIRGGSGAGKSTLVAAAWKEGLSVLGDESLLARRDDPDDLLATVRDLTILSDSARLLGLMSDTEPAFSGGEEKRRIDLYPESSPADRSARRCATLLIGARNPGPARTVRLSPEEFANEFAQGEIPQERMTGDPDPIARSWGKTGGFRLDGTEDIAGAVRLIRELSHGA